MKMRRILSVFTALTLLLTLFGAGASAATDTTGHWAEAIIANWTAAKKISGYGDGTFRPDNNMTRAEYATLLSNITKDPSAEGETAPQYADVSQDDWFYSSVEKLLHIGALSGGDAFRPDEYITRQDAMTMAGKAFYVRGFDAQAIEGFADFAEIADYAQDYVAGFVENGFVVGYEDNTIRPQNPITRAECVKMLDGLDVVHDPASLKGIIDRLYEGVGETMPDTHFEQITDQNAEYYLGLKTLDGIDEAVASEAVMRPVAHSVCLVRASEGTDVEALMEQIRTSVNPNKWICTGVDPENVKVVNQGSLILLSMTNFASQQLADTFLALDLSPKPLLTPDENGLYYADGYYMDDIGGLRPASVENFAAKVEALCGTYLTNSAGVYYAVIPSKSYFVNDRLPTPFDYDTMHSLLSSGIQSAQYIDLFGALTLDDYYQTDPHWRQERLQGVTDRLGASLGFELDLSKNQAHTVDGFTGQHGYNKDGFPSEQLTYLTNRAIDSAFVENTEKPDFHQVYELEKLSSDAPYDMFLSGPSPLITITNSQAATGKELVIFRDSYACSLAPLLIENYSAITLIDLRYVLSQMLGNYVSFDGKDVLFLYNDQVVNYSEMLK